MRFVCSINRLLTMEQHEIEAIRDFSLFAHVSEKCINYTEVGILVIGNAVLFCAICITLLNFISFIFFFK